MERNVTSVNATQAFRRINALMHVAKGSHVEIVHTMICVTGATPRQPVSPRKTWMCFIHIKPACRSHIKDNVKVFITISLLND